MISPVDARLDAAMKTPSGYIVPSGLRSFMDSLKGPKAASAFNDWRQEHFTKKLFLAIQDMILHQPKEVQNENILVQLGVTQGLALAAQLVSDPSVLWPTVFGEGLESPSVSQPSENVEADYGTTINDLIDR